MQKIQNRRKIKSKKNLIYIKKFTNDEIKSMLIISFD